MNKSNVALTSLASLARLVLLVCGAMLLVNPFLPQPQQLTIGYQIILGLVTVVAVLALVGITAIIDERANEDRKKRTDELEKQADPRAAWELARLKLEEYFDRNLDQVKMIFYVAIGVMAAGFIFVIWGLHAAVTNPSHIDVAKIASASGVITQFIGVTFMVIYRNTMLQATQYVSVLEKINTVGMAVGILEAMKEDAGDLKDVTRVEIVRMLLAPPSTRMSFNPRLRKGSSKVSSKSDPAKDAEDGVHEEESSRRSGSKRP
jgi:uncharacterized protein YhhL (DUF1145 family)/putative ubiquitin-RnfH superfamily antitoxin RatB of RatAB toxin-antitoxin module